MGKGMRAGKKPGNKMGGFGGGNMQKQLQQVQAMQRQMENIQAEIEKIQLEINNIPAIHFIDETYAYYYNAYSLLTGFINSNLTDYTFMDNLCRLVYKSNNRWGNPNNRFI